MAEGSVTISGNKVYGNQNGGAISANDHNVGGIIVYSAASRPAVEYAVIEDNELLKTSDRVFCSTK